MGKSSFVSEMLVGNGCAAQSFVYYADKGNFFMESFDPRMHKVILFGDFDLNNFPAISLEKLVGAKMYEYPAKGRKGRKLQFLGPVIFVSNLINITDKALLARLKIAHAREPADRLDVLPNTKNSLRTADIFVPRITPITPTETAALAE